jgi:hypothetical protein
MSREALIGAVSAARITTDTRRTQAGPTVPINLPTRKPLTGVCGPSAF